MVHKRFLTNYDADTGSYSYGTSNALFITYSKSIKGDFAMNKVIVTIALLLCTASAYADDHRGHNHDEHDNGHHYGQLRKHDSPRSHECRNERDWRFRTVVYHPEYREVRELPTRYVTYRPEYRKAQPQMTISVQTPGLVLSFLTGR